MAVKVFICPITLNLLLQARKYFFRKILNSNIIHYGNNMNYRHAYHAGNFADVFKHVALIILLQSFLKKETPFCYLDTHAGIACYDLNADSSQRSKEYKFGIEKVLSAADKPDIIQ